MSEHRMTTPRDRDTSDVAQREGRHVQATVADAASSVGGTAAEHGREITGQARQHATSIVEDATGTLRRHAREEAQRAGAALSTAGDQLQALADGRVDEAGVLGDYVEQMAESVNRLAGAVQERGLEGLLDDVRTYGRRRPGMFLLGALAAGVAVGRFGRNVAPALDGADDGGRRQLPRSAEPDDGDDRRGGDGDGGPRTISSTRSMESGFARSARIDDVDDRSSSSDELIVGHATDDSAVVQRRGEVADRPVDADRGRGR